MSTASSAQSLVEPSATADPGRGTGRFRLPYILLMIAGALILLSVVRVLTDANDLTSRGTMREALQWAIPIGLAGLGGLWSERAGVVNIGLEGMMILGTWFGAWAGVHYGPWQGVAFGIVGGALGGLLHALATVTFGVDHIVSGVAITILGAGIARYLSGLTFAKMEGGGPTNSPTIADIDRISLPVIPDALADVEKQRWAVVSDLAGILGGVTADVSLLTIVAVLLVPLTYVLLWRTAFGLRLRSCGENPLAAESLGVNVYRYKYIAVVVSGALAGLGGVYLAEVSSSLYREGQTNGRGYIGLATMIFGNWRPGGLAAGAGLFGFTDALQQRPAGGESVHALLLFVALLIAALGVRNLLRRRYVAAAVPLVIALLTFLWFVLQSDVPREFVGFMPHLTTLLVLALAAQRLRPPKADGLPYRRGQAG
jgi:simple sugar transport system permease protein